MSAESTGPAMPDFSQAKLLGGIPDAVKVEAERQAGVRCGKCERRVHYGTSYAVLRAEATPAGPAVVLGNFTCCWRQDCDAVEYVFANFDVVYSTDVRYLWYSEDHQPEPRNLPEPPVEVEDAKS